MGFDTEFAIIGHRGAAGLAPENTLPSFRAALAHGVDAIELDVHRVEDTLVVIHDDTLERTTNGRGSILAAGIAGLRTLDAGGGANVPTLDEVLAITPPDVAINIELKGAQTAPLAAAAVRDHGDHEFLVSSFDHGELERFRALDSTTLCAPLVKKLDAPTLGVAAAVDAWSVNVGNRGVTKKDVVRIVDAGFRALVYTVNDARRATELRRWGVAGVFTDYPDRVRS